MNAPRLPLLLLFVAVLAFATSSPSRADNDGSLQDVHDLLIKAAGDSADNPPPADQQKQLLDDAIKEIHHIPHVYHGTLNQASRDIESALTELSSGDAAHKARNDILDAADLIKSLMN